MRKLRNAFRRSSGLGALALAGALAATLLLSPPGTAQGAQPPTEAAPQGQTSLRAADPSVLRVGSTYVGVQSTGGGIVVRQASSTDGLATAPARQVWSDTRGRGEVWAPAISSASPDTGYGPETQLALPDDKWAIDGTLFTFEGQRWFVWSGWAGDTNVEQNLYIARMSSPTRPTGARYVISQPRESWERVVGNPFINESPEAIKDPNGQLHLTYSANGSWSDQYCLADLRLRKGGDPTYVWDWYKSNGCLFGSNRATMMAGWDPTLYVNGPGHHTFVRSTGTSTPARPQVRGSRRCTTRSRRAPPTPGPTATGTPAPSSGGARPPTPAPTSPAPPPTRDGA